MEQLSDEDLTRYCAEFRQLHERYATQLAERVQEKKTGAKKQPASAPRATAKLR